jgi:hypothetical protein
MLQQLSGPGYGLPYLSQRILKLGQAVVQPLSCKFTTGPGSSNTIYSSAGQGHIPSPSITSNITKVPLGRAISWAGQN